MFHANKIFHASKMFLSLMSWHIDSELIIKPKPAKNTSTCIPRVHPGFHIVLPTCCHDGMHSQCQKERTRIQSYWIYSTYIKHEEATPIMK